MQRPPVSPDLAAAVGQLAQLRREIRRLEVEEEALRGMVLQAVADWPAAWFPVRVGGHELRRHERVGRLDESAARRTLAEAGLLEAVPLEPVVRDPAAMGRLFEQVAALEAAGGLRGIRATLEAAVEWVRRPTVEVVRTLWDTGRLDDDRYRACFRDGRPVIVVLVVR
ncbi:MAG: hypothetical protein K6V97_10180 [Actinomycetia bacterium]|nr:hypothetical protein [Actinomycetes bacterium]